MVPLLIPSTILLTIILSHLEGIKCLLGLGAPDRGKGSLYLKIFIFFKILILFYFLSFILKITQIQQNNHFQLYFCLPFYLTKFF